MDRTPDRGLEGETRRKAFRQRELHNLRLGSGMFLVIWGIDCDHCRVLIGWVWVGDREADD